MQARARTLRVLSVLVSLSYKVSGYYCDGGHYCATAAECCAGGCCYTYPLQRPAVSPPPRTVYAPLDLLAYHHWYFWSVVVAVCVVVACMWCLWRRRARLCGRRRRTTTDRDSTGSCYLPPHYSRCGSFHRPPPYNEVTSKPDMYPLVITYGDGGDKGGGGGNYLMVHYFRNYIIRPPGSVSAASTVDSLNSSFLCNAANEANIQVPPPYTAAHASDWRGVPRSLSAMTYMDEGASAGIARLDSSPEPDPRVYRTALLRDRFGYDVAYEMCDAPLRPRLGLSPEPCEIAPTPLGEEVSTWSQLYESMLHADIERGGCASPPRPTSPTLVQDARKHRIKKAARRKTSLYMPLHTAPIVRSRASPVEGGRQRTPAFSTMSAPTTPCGGLVPSLLSLSRMSGSVLGSRGSRLPEETESLLDRPHHPDNDAF